MYAQIFLSCTGAASDSEPPADTAAPDPPTLVATAAVSKTMPTAVIVTPMTTTRIGYGPQGDAVVPLEMADGCTATVSLLKPSLQHSGPSTMAKISWLRRRPPRIGRHRPRNHRTDPLRQPDR